MEKKRHQTVGARKTQAHTRHSHRNGRLRHLGSPSALPRKDRRHRHIRGYAESGKGEGEARTSGGKGRNEEGRLLGHVVPRQHVRRRHIGLRHTQLPRPRQGIGGDLPSDEARRAAEPGGAHHTRVVPHEAALQDIFAHHPPRLRKTDLERQGSIPIPHCIH